MLNKAKMLAVWAMVAAVSSVAMAGVGDWNGQMVDVEFWVDSAIDGSGDNAALCVMDFKDPTTAVGPRYAFGYRWDDSETIDRPGTSTYAQNNPTVGSNTSEALLLTLDGQGGAAVVSSYHNIFGFSLTSLSYDGETMVGDWGAGYYLGLWWDGNTAWDDGFTGSGPAAAPNGTFDVSGMGASSRLLEDGFADAWSLELSASYPAANTPTYPAPEPATMTLLGIGAVAMLRRRK